MKATTTLQIGIFLLLIGFAIGATSVPSFGDQPILKIAFFACCAGGGMLVGGSLARMKTKQ